MRSQRAGPEGDEFLIAAYRSAAAGMADPNPRLANVQHRRLHEVFKALRATEKGRAAVVSLLGDANPHVVLSAASHAMTWAPEVARPVLEQLADSDGPGSFDAIWVLREYDEGKLSFDYD